MVDICTHGNRPAECVDCRHRTSWPARDLMSATFPPARFAVPDLIPDGLTFFAGAPKLGKSWMALGLGLAIASGGRALGTIDVEAGEVLYLALEDSPRRLQERLSMVLADESPPDGLTFETAWPRMGSGGSEAIETWIGDHPDARLVIVDVFTRIRAPELKRADLYRADYEAATELQAIATRSGVAIVAIYHTRKTEDPDFVAMMSGTFGLAAGADTILIARRGRGEADATLYATGRDITEQELALRFSPEARTWAILGDAAVYNLGETRRELYEAVKDHETLTPKQAASVTSVNYELAKKTLQRMAKDGELKADRGRYSLQTNVPGVPLSLDDDEQRDKGTLGTLSRRDADREVVPSDATTMTAAARLLAWRRCRGGVVCKGYPLNKTVGQTSASGEGAEPTVESLGGAELEIRCCYGTVGDSRFTDFRTLPGVGRTEYVAPQEGVTSHRGMKRDHGRATA